MFVKLTSESQIEVLVKTYDELYNDRELLTSRLNENNQSYLSSKYIKKLDKLINDLERDLGK